MGGVSPSAKNSQQKAALTPRMSLDLGPPYGALAISVPVGRFACFKHFQERVPYACLTFHKSSEPMFASEQTGR
jgi:hypothetical protein